MKLSSPSTLLLTATLISSAQAWDKDDHEIFRLKDELDKFEGPGVTFYDFLEVTRAAKQVDIDRAFRRRSRAMHPDKARQSLIAERSSSAAAQASSAASEAGGAKPSTGPLKPPTAREVKAAEKLASERFTRLGLIAEILRDDRRASYDHFLDNGFPAWRGTGYYYNRFRPGLFSTLAGLFIFSGGVLHYIVLVLGYKQQRDFVERYIRQARQAAWGNNQTQTGGSIPGLSNAALGTGAETGSAEEESPLVEAINRRERRAADKESKKKNRDNKTLKPAAGRTGGSGTVTPQESAVASSGTSTPVPGARKRIEAENGKILVVDRAGNVFLEEEDEETEETNLLLLDPAEIERPTFRQTFLYRLPAWVVDVARERAGAFGIGKATTGTTADGEGGDDTDTGAPSIHIDGVSGRGGGGLGSGSLGDVITATPSARQRKRKGKK